MIPIALTALAALVPSATAACSRESLLAAASAYVAAQAGGKTDGLALSADNFTYRENNKAAEVARGLLSQALPIDLNRSAADATACASYTTFVSATGPKPYVVATQIRHEGSNSSAGPITSIDTIAATTGDLFFNAERTLGYLRAEDWSELPEAGRPTRELLRKFGDAYLDMWTDAKAADSIAWGTDCERVEGSSLTRPCGASLPHGGSARNNGDRRYVIDEVGGTVDVLCSFDALGSLPDSHAIHVVDNKVKYVHTVTVGV